MIEKKRAPSRVIRPQRFKAELARLELPYTVFQQPPFRLDSALRAYEYQNGGPEKKVMTAEKQRQHFDSAVASLTSPDTIADGWTMALAGDVHLGVLEAIAASLAGVALRSNRDVLWLDMSTAFKKGIYEIWDAPQLQLVPRSPKLVVITGLIDASAPMRWARATDLLRSTSRSMCRIVVCAGHTPHDAMRHMRMPYHYALCATKPVTIHN